MPAFRDLTLEPPFGRLTALERGPNRGRTTRWWCLCDCGNRVLVGVSELTTGNTQSCGCLNSELARQRRQTHGMYQRPEYWVWVNMRQRCQNPHVKHYVDYGGRGIAVCERWQSFEAFFADMGPRPSPAHTLERQDNHGPYSPANCVWDSRQAQARNTRHNHMITLDGKTACLLDWLRDKDRSPVTFHQRVKRGWSVERALLQPSRKKKHTTPIEQ